MVVFESKAWDELLKLGYSHDAGSRAGADSAYFQQLFMLASKFFTEAYNQYDLRTSVAKKHRLDRPRLHIMSTYFGTRNPAWPLHGQTESLDRVRMDAICDIAGDAELDLYVDDERDVSAALVSINAETGAEYIEDEPVYVHEQYLDNVVSFL